MPFFRRTLDISHAQLRAGAPTDLPAVSRLIRDSTHRFISAPSSDLPALVNSAPVMLLASDQELLGVAIAGWPVDDITWLRSLALADGVSLNNGIHTLLPPFYALLRSQGLRRLFYAGDISADTWIQPSLIGCNWERETEVVVYEKHGHIIPSRGNPLVRIRRAQTVDLPSILALDRASFAVHWVKDESVISPALVDMPFFVIAELHGEAVGYAFATTHFHGRLIHLVRIAVDPRARGQSVGVRLMAEVTGFAKSIGADTLTLNTQQENRTAQRLYEWFGFHRTGEKQTVLRYDL
jgi:ribosomal protein S18 acetylase RimI-like enzyme